MAPLAPWRLAPLPVVDVADESGRLKQKTEHELLGHRDPEPHLDALLRVAGEEPEQEHGDPAPRLDEREQKKAPTPCHPLLERGAGDLLGQHQVPPRPTSDADGEAGSLNL